MYIDITDKNRAIEYFKSPRINVSTLKNLNNPIWIKLKRENPYIEDEEKRHFRVGRVLDTMLTDPENFSKEFIVLKTDRPSTAMEKFISNLPLNLDENSPEDEYIEAYEASGFKSPVGSIIKRLWKNDVNSNYYKHLHLAKGKTIISKDEYEEALICRDSLINNPFTSHFFINNNPEVSIFYQVPLYFEYKEVECKGLIDILVVNYKENTIQIVDLKSTGRSVLSFPSSYITLRYYLQGAFYELGLKTLIKEKKSFREQLGVSEDVKIKHMQFVVAEKKGNNPSRIFQMTEEEVEKATHGIEDSIDNLLTIYKWHEDNNLWEYPYEMYQNKGIYLLSKL